MWGAIVGDVIGSVHEYVGTKTKDFDLFVEDSTFTDDSVLSVAVADWLLNGRDLVDLFHEYAHAFRGRGYGIRFGEWVYARRREAYGSYGNGSAMRVSPVGFAFDDLDQALDVAARSAAVTHDHPAGVLGAQATATAIFLARHGLDREAMREALQSRFGYDLSTRLDDLRPHYDFDETCPGTVPQALIAFLESSSYEDAIRNAVSLGGDADTLACICGGVAEAYYGGVPSELLDRARERLDPRLVEVVDRFQERFRSKPGSDAAARPRA